MRHILKIKLKSNHGRKGHKLTYVSGKLFHFKFFPITNFKLVGLRVEATNKTNFKFLI